MDHLHRYLRQQLAQIVDLFGATGPLPTFTVLDVRVGDQASDPRMHYEVLLRVGEVETLIIPVNDEDGGTSGTLRDRSAAATKSGLTEEHLDALANAIWWAIGDAVFLAGLQASSGAIDECNQALVKAWMSTD
jgi:hypothetical protein